MRLPGALVARESVGCLKVNVGGEPGVIDWAASTQSSLLRPTTMKPFNRQEQKQHCRTKVSSHDYFTDCYLGWGRSFHHMPLQHRRRLRSHAS